MKKLLLTILLAVLVCCTLVPCCANADVTVDDAQSRGYALTALTKGNNYVGVQMEGVYFGQSCLPVTVEIYSSQQRVIDFDVNATNLVGKQLDEQEKIVNLCNQIDAKIRHVDKCANAQNPLSQVYAYNNASSGQSVEIDYDMYQMLLVAMQAYQLTDGAFNPALYRLVDLWGFSSRAYNGFVDVEKLPYDREWKQNDDGTYFYPLPQQKYVDAFSAPEFVDFSQSVTLETKGEGQRLQYFVTKNAPSVTVDGIEYQQWLDLGGVAKGYCADVVNQMIKDDGYDVYYVNVGTSSQSFAKSTAQDGWKVSVINPNNANETLFAVNASNCAISTSGQYVRQYCANGVRYSHIIDGKTGVPSQTGAQSVTVILPDSLSSYPSCLSDCISTALSVLSPQQIVSLVNGYFAQNGVKIAIVYQTEQGESLFFTNYQPSEVVKQSSQMRNMPWVLLKQSDGTFAYDQSSQVVPSSQPKTLWIFILLFCLVVTTLVTVSIYFVISGKSKQAQKSQSVCVDKPFKWADVGVYLAVALVVAILFLSLWGANGGLASNDTISCVKIVDMTNGNVLLTCYALQNEVQVAPNTGFWSVDVQQTNRQFTITLSKMVDGKLRYNKVQITTQVTPTVTVTEANCGMHKHCVNVFGTLSVANGAIVCSPNMLKIVTK